MTDPIADMLTRIRNALLNRSATVGMPHSKLKEAIIKTFKDEGYIVNYQVENTQPAKTIMVTLKYIGTEPAISHLKRISKPGRRLYSGYDSLIPPLSGYGVTIVSTSRGVMTDKLARSQKLGGELVCQIW